MAGRRRAILTAVAIVGAAAAVVTGAVVATGYDAQEAGALDTSVWVTRDAGQYARVDTDLGQIDTVRDAEDPAAVVQHGAASIVYSGGFQRMWAVDAARPAALVSSTEAASGTGTASSTEAGSAAAGSATPSGTRTVVASGEWTVYLTDTGRVFVAALSATGAAATPVQIDPLRAEGGGRAAYAATAVAVADDGTIVLYSAAERAVRRYDAGSARFVDGAAALSDPPPAEARVALTVVGGRWALADVGTGRLWIQGHDAPVGSGLGTDAVAERGASRGSRAYFADSAGLVAVALADGRAERVAGAGTGTPAAPVRVDGEVYAAWLGAGGGALWSESGGTRALEVPAGQLDPGQDVAPVIATNGRRAVLDETRTGMLWTIPDGAVIPLSQWTADEDQDRRQEGTVQVPDVAQQEPPVAEADAFGVRAGSFVSLPVLLNDHDPNRKDVLTIDPGSIAGGAGSFARLALANDRQQIVAQILAESGSATFAYAVTDGQAASPPTTVTLTVVPEARNTAPEWCGVPGCLQPWPTVAVAPGGTATVPVLDAWVDPEGDPVALAGAAKDDPAAPLTVLPTADGRVAIRHVDPNAPGGTYAVTVTVTDSRGARATKTLAVSVTANPPLEIPPIAAVAGVGQERTIAIADHVRGGSGSYRLLDAVAAGSASGAGANDALTVVPNAAAGTIALTARAPGEYAVGFRVQDAQTRAEQSGTLRLSVAAQDGPLALPPLTAFVRAGEDTTLDVLAAVQSTTDRVLAIASATTDDPGLSVAVVEGSRLRLAGTTADGRPGTVGSTTVTVTDNAGDTASGAVTVFLVDPALGVGPLAVPDAVTVRAGAQTDVALTANDIAPRGERIVVHPALEGSGAPGELAFVAGASLRYLAPADPGVYTLRYSVYLEGDPTRLDSATVTVTVVAAGENRAPEPTTLVARVAAGSSVTIPVPATGTDPDGDSTALVGVEQPPARSGAVTISADGGSLTYTAPANGVSGGQVSFGYTVRDAQGAQGVGRVRVGVLGGQLADVAPVTYSDAVRAVVGTTQPLTVLPLANDRDPARGALELVSIEPNVPAGTPEHARLQSLLDARTDLGAGVVAVRAGDVQGVHSYVYTVRSTATSSTAQGLVVVTVATQTAPDQPVVADTVLTLADRGTLDTGVDVVSGKAVWASGDVSRLSLSVWGEAASRYTVRGSTIAGPAPVAGALVPFRLSGTDAAGGEVAAYGFLRVPAFDDMRVQLAGGGQPFRVGEDESVTIPASDAVRAGPGDAIEIRGGEPFAVQRAQATCAAAGGSAVRYSAGREAPWSDSCTVAVRVAGQQTWTLLPVPVAIQPKSPQAVLGAVSRTIAPGQSQTVDLVRDMTTWEGGRVGDPSQLDYRVAFAGSDFVVEQTGTVVTVTARADARPGSRQAATVSVTGFGGLSSTLSLTVSAAPADTPRGATFSQTCTVSAGPGCAVTVIGAPGEYDPFAGKVGAGLTLAGVGDASCAVARVGAAGTAIVATWPTSAKPAGGTCTIPYTVADAQGRTGGGTLTLDVQGYPAPPRTVAVSAYTGSSVTLSVPLGDAANAHPPLAGVAVYENGAAVRSSSCTPAAGGTYSCTVGDLVNGQRHAYTVRAVNAVGESADTTPVPAWAYQAPRITDVTAAPVVVPGRLLPSAGVVEVRITGGEDIAEYRIEPDGGAAKTVARADDVTVTRMELPVGVRTLRVTPLSQFQPPSGSAGNAGEQRTVTVRVASSPTITSDGELRATSNTGMELRGLRYDDNSSDLPTSVVYAIWRTAGGSEPSCTMTTDGRASMPGSQSGTAFTGLDAYGTYSAKACVANGYGAVESRPVSGLAYTDAPAASDGLTYEVRTAPTVKTATRAEWTDFVAPAVTPRTGFDVRYDFGNGRTSTTFSLDPDRAPGAVTYRYCLKDPPPSVDPCGDPAAIGRATVPTTVTVSVDAAPVASPRERDVVFSGAVDSSASRSVAVATDPETTTVTYTVTFTGPYSPLGTVTLTRPLATSG